MLVTRFRAALAGALLLAACDRSPTEPLEDQALLDSVDPVVLTFAATQGLPGAPFVADGGPPMIRGPMTPMMTGFAGTAARHGPGAPFPDSLRLTEAQRTAIKALVDAFHTANAADLAALRAIHQQVRDAIQAGKSREEVRAIAQTARPILERLHAAREALQQLFALVPEKADALLAHALRPENRPTSYHSIVSVLNRSLSMQDKVKLIESMWRVAHVDREIDMYEDHLVRKISDLLYLSHTDFIHAKHRARGR